MGYALGAVQRAALFKFAVVRDGGIPALAAKQNLSCLSGIEHFVSRVANATDPLE